MMITPTMSGIHLLVAAADVTDAQPEMTTQMMTEMSPTPHRGIETQDDKQEHSQHTI